MPLKRKHEIKDPKDLIPDIADLEDDDLPEIDDIEIGPEDVIDLEAEEPLHLGPILAEEMSEDPVRLYLREIGQVKLLGSDSEFRLATMIESYRLLQSMERRVEREGVDHATSVYRAVLDEMVMSWKRVEEDSARLNVHLPDLPLVLAESQALRQGFNIDFGGTTMGSISDTAVLYEDAANTLFGTSAAIITLGDAAAPTARGMGLGGVPHRDAFLG